MSMNDLHTQMVQFHRALREFNDAIGGSYRDLLQRHDALKGIWNDDFRKRFDSEWEPLKDIMERYLHTEVRDREDYCEEKIRKIERYLNS